MLALVISPHAVDRYVERIGGTRQEALDLFTGQVVRRAINFGARCIRLPGGAGRKPGRVLIRFVQDATLGPTAVVTSVVPLNHLPAQLHPHAYGGPRPVAAVTAAFTRKEP